MDSEARAAVNAAPRESYRPSEEEAKYYYWGLPTRPKLVARTSAIESPFNPQGRAKYFLPLQGTVPPRLATWNDCTSDLRQGILQALEQVQWTGVDVLNYGTEDLHAPTLLISVLHDSTSWEQGLDAAQACKAVLEGCGINDMHCEVRESVAALSMDEDDAAAPDFCLSSRQEFLLDEQAYISDRVGLEIATENNPNRRGTKGIYLAATPDKPDAKPITFALTCRHVVIDTNILGTARYEADTQSTELKVVHLSQTTFEEAVSAIRTEVDGCRTKMQQKDSHSDRAWFEDHLPRYTELLERLGPYENPSSRSIGHVRTSAEFAPRPGAEGHEWLSDWALIQLSAQSHETPIGSLVNLSWVGAAFDQYLPKQNRLLPLTNSWTPPSLPEVAFRARAVRLGTEPVPLKELLIPGEAEDHPVLDVLTGKVVMIHGANSKLQIGMTSVLKSVARIPIKGQPSVQSEQIPVVSVGRTWKEHRPFSQGGDSGSCVWDVETQRPVGILDSGLGGSSLEETRRPPHHDVSYVQPMVFILEDIARSGYKDVTIV